MWEVVAAVVALFLSCTIEPFCGGVLACVALQRLGNRLAS